MKKYPNRLWIVVFLLGWTFDLLFWEHSLGLNFSLFSSLCLLSGFGLLLADGFRPVPKTLWLLIPFVFFAVITFVRQEPLTIFLAYTFSILSLVLMANTYLSGRWAQYGLTDYVVKSLSLVQSMIIRPFEFNSALQKEHRESGQLARPLPMGSVLRGALIALPIVIFFASMLASADLVFNQKLTDFLDRFEPDEISDYIKRTIYILMCAYALAGIFLHALLKSGDEKLLGEEKPLTRRFLGFTESAIVLGSVSVLFLTFVIIQFQYFFGGQSNIGVEDYTYSEYARRGFNELVSVAFFSLVMILGLNGITRRETELQKRIYSGLCIFMVILVMVILVSAYQRIALGIDWHGYSRLRLYPRTFLIWVGILFVAIVGLESFRYERYYAFAFLLASLGFGVSLVFLNVDRAIVEYNLPRILAGKNLNVIHLSSLSTDAIPALVDGYRDARYSQETHEGIGAILLCYIHSDSIKDDTSQEHWQSLNASRTRAYRALIGVVDELDRYTFLEKRYPMMMRTPGSLRYECSE